MSEPSFQPRLALVLLVAATILGLMGTDLVLPAVPSLPDTLGGGPAEGQLVLASYVAGTCIGLLVFGALGDRFSVRTLFVGSMLITGLVSFGAGAAQTIWALVGLRLIQGAAAAAPAVFALAIIRSMFDERGAIRALGALGSIEALAPALAPIFGVWLLGIGGWRLSFGLLGALALFLMTLNLVLPLIPQVNRRQSGSYVRLLFDAVYLRYALSQALVLGGLLVFVFGAPAVLVRSFGGTIGDFIVMQVVGIASFVVLANLADGFAARFGAERMILIGTALAATGAGAMLVYGLAGGGEAWAVAVLFVPINAGLGLRGPPAVYRTVLASQGDDARGSALLMLLIMFVAAAGTALVAPLITHGLVPLAAMVFCLQLIAAALLLLPTLAPSTLNESGRSNL